MRASEAPSGPKTFLAYAAIGRVYLGAGTRSEAILEAKTKYSGLQKIVECVENTVWSKEDRHN